MAKAGVDIVRVYEDPGRHRGELRVLVDRLWPRGLSKEVVDYDEWAKEATPSNELRRWYGHDPAKFDMFSDRYRHELNAPLAVEAVAHLREVAKCQWLVLLTATRDVEHSSATVLRGVIEHSIR